MELSSKLAKYIFKLQISINEYKGKSYLDMRIYYTTDDGLNWLPTKKGVTVSPENLELLKDCFIKSENRQIIGVLNSFSCFLWKTFAKWAQYGRNQARAFLFCKPVEFRFPIRSI